MPRHNRQKISGLITLLVASLLSGCVSDGNYPNPHLSPNQTTGGIGVSSEEFAQITAKLVDDLSALSFLKERGSAARIYFDASLFKNDSPQAVDKGVLVSRIRSGLMRSSGSGVVFVQATDQFDYVLTGRFSAKTSVNPSIGSYERYNQIAFELYDLSAGQQLVWTEIYESNKSVIEDSIYR